MKAGWEVRPLGEVLSVIRNGISRKQLKGGVGCAVTRIESISSGSIDLDKVGRLDLIEAEKEKYRLYCGDILFSHINSPVHVGKTAIFDGSAELYHGMNLMLLRTISSVDPRYLEYNLQKLRSTGYWEVNSKQSVNQASVNQKDIKKVPIPLPPLEEQRRIVAVLDEAFEGLNRARENTETNLTNARELFESVLDEVIPIGKIGWKSENISDICIVGDGNHSSKYPKKSEMVDAGVPFIRSSNIQNGLIDISDLLYISEAKHAALVKGHLKAGDILFTNRGEIGKLAILPLDLDNSNLNSQVAWLRTKGEVLSDFLFFALQSGRMKRHFASTQSGAALQQFTIKMLKSVIVEYPKMALQTAIVQTLNEAWLSQSVLEQAYQTKLTDLEDLRQSLLQKAFAGELT